MQKKKKLFRNDSLVIETSASWTLISNFMECYFFRALLHGNSYYLTALQWAQRLDSDSIPMPESGFSRSALVHESAHPPISVDSPHGGQICNFRPRIKQFSSVQSSMWSPKQHAICDEANLLLPLLLCAQKLILVLLHNLLTE